MQREAERSVIVANARVADAEREQEDAAAAAAAEIESVRAAAEAAPRVTRASSPLERKAHAKPQSLR